MINYSIRLRRLVIAAMYVTIFGAYAELAAQTILPSQVTPQTLRPPPRGGADAYGIGNENDELLLRRQDQKDPNVKKGAPGKPPNAADDSTKSERSRQR